MVVRWQGNLDNLPGVARLRLGLLGAMSLQLMPRRVRVIGVNGMNTVGMLKLHVGNKSRSSHGLSIRRRGNG